MNTLYTIGHSNHRLDKFLDLLTQHNINAVCDVRSYPYSKYNPQFNHPQLREKLSEINIAYVFLGKELGGRTSDINCYRQGKVQYDLVAKTTLFNDGMQRLQTGVKSYYVALMCAEKDPLNCHRLLLICRHLQVDDLTIQHIDADGNLENQKAVEQRLLAKLKLENLELAYEKQSQKTAYVNDKIGENNAESLYNRLYQKNCPDIF